MSIRPHLRGSVWVAGGVAVAAVVVTTMGFLVRDAGADASFAAPLPTLAAPEVAGVVVARLTPPPRVPPPIRRDHPARVVVELEAMEREMPIAEGATYRFWTFGGTVPGSFIRVREGDRVEFHLRNAADSEFPHNIDLHAVTGTGGGAAASITMPGRESVFEFAALNPGLYVYHCAMPGMVATHVANGMYGLILVEPRNGLPAVDREFYIVQGDFYTTGETGDAGLQAYDFDAAVREDADYVVFNGRVGAMTGERALRARRGESVRLYVGNGGPNLSSSFHVIGEVLDNVYREGGTTVSHNVQTTMIPAGGAAIVEFRLENSGQFHFVDHAIFRAMHKGALGTLAVEGEEDPTVFRALEGPTE